MWRTACIIGVVLVVLVLSAQNMHRTRVNFPFTQGFEVSTAFLLALCFGLGYAAARLAALIKGWGRRGGKRDER